MSRKITKLIVGLMIPACAAAALAYTTDQAAHGKELYVTQCAVCHGANGQGGPVPDRFPDLKGEKAPPLVGPGFLPGMKTVGQVYDFASKAMPANNPGSLKSDEYLDIISFDLQANGIKPDGTPLTPDSAKEIMIPGRD